MFRPSRPRHIPSCASVARERVSLSSKSHLFGAASPLPTTAGIPVFPKGNVCKRHWPAGEIQHPSTVWEVFSAEQTPGDFPLQNARAIALIATVLIDPEVLGFHVEHSPGARAVPSTRRRFKTVERVTKRSGTFLTSCAMTNVPSPFSDQVTRPPSRKSSVLACSGVKFLYQELPIFTVNRACH